MPSTPPVWRADWRRSSTWSKSMPGTGMAQPTRYSPRMSSVKRIFHLSSGILKMLRKLESTVAPQIVGAGRQAGWGGTGRPD